ncbi:hypothetical protein MRB53_025992 [Persea americana]|uniref:Uncharacterized protein n=1 Tax=Persea americana TaxID=3435 RepID=A0ACC2LGV0_PERAE|nr:hypothetical protein MRB53_025992 [Persea americana]
MEIPAEEIDSADGNTKVKNPNFAPWVRTDRVNQTLAFLLWRWSSPCAGDLPPVRKPEEGHDGDGSSDLLLFKPRRR